MLRASSCTSPWMPEGAKAGPQSQPQSEAGLRRKLKCCEGIRGEERGQGVQEERSLRGSKEFRATGLGQSDRCLWSREPGEEHSAWWPKPASAAVEGSHAQI